MKQVPRAAKSKHLLIAGTGRSGTSFLVRYFHELGYDTHIDRNASEELHDMANAGLEDVPLTVPIEDLPYVVKTPWLYQFVEQFIGDDRFAVDGVIIPVRSLKEAAVSRTTVEMHNIHRSIDWMPKLDKTWTEWGTTPGGVLYSTEPLDQARILATGFHHLIESLLAHDIPFVLLSFPRLIEDSDYLYDKLRPLLQKSLTRDRAKAAHKAVADVDQVRTTKELRGSKQDEAAKNVLPSPTEIENLALKRELTSLRENLDSTTKQLEEERESLVRGLDEMKKELDSIHSSTSWKLANSVRFTNTKNAKKSESDTD